MTKLMQDNIENYILQFKSNFKIVNEHILNVEENFGYKVPNEEENGFDELPVYIREENGLFIINLAGNMLDNSGMTETEQLLFFCDWISSELLNLIILKFNTEYFKKLGFVK